MSKDSGDVIDLPYAKVSVERQLELIQSILAIYEETEKGVSRRDVAPIVTLAVDNVSRCVGFWISIGVLERAEGSRYQPSEDFIQVLSSDNDLREALQKHILESWIGSLIRLKSKIKPKFDVNELKDSIAKAFKTQTGKKASECRINTLFDLLTEIKLIAVLDDIVTFIHDSSESDKTTRKILEIPNDKDIILLEIHSNIYAIDREALVCYIEREGKSVSDKLRID
ncbi:MAG: hypothetical protein JW779_05570 [Candidatus Thorarchaeota archaeon]|nr:hypothetical protein [Candidatus Thorarchaeota archaeon]